MYPTRAQWGRVMEITILVLQPTTAALLSQVFPKGLAQEGVVVGKEQEGIVVIFITRQPITYAEALQVQEESLPGGILFLDFVRQCWDVDSYKRTNKQNAQILGRRRGRKREGVRG